MKLSSLLILAVGSLGLAGCSSTPTKVDTGVIHARTFSFVNRAGRPDPAFTDNRQPVHQMIQDSITKTLTAKGATKVATVGDVTVGYLVIIGDGVTTESIDDYFGYGQNTTALREKAHDAYSDTKNPNFHEAGTLVIDIIDSRSYKLLKRGYATKSSLKNLPADVKAARIQEVVDKILGDLRIKP